MPSLMLDKNRILKLTAESFALLEEKYGSADAAFTRLREGSFTALLDLLWAALVHEDPFLTPRDVGRMITVSDVSRVARALNEAINEAFGGPSGLLTKDEAIGPGEKVAMLH